MHERQMGGRRYKHCQWRATRTLAERTMCGRDVSITHTVMHQSNVDEIRTVKTARVVACRIDSLPGREGDLHVVPEQYRKFGTCWSCDFSAQREVTCHKIGDNLVL